jgi:CheY-like chemotaxis protein
MDDPTLDQIDEVVRLINTIVQSSIFLEGRNCNTEPINKAAISLITPINNILIHANIPSRLERRIDGTITRSQSQVYEFDTPPNKDIEIIVADDNPIDQMMMMEVLRTIGYENIRLANNGFQALNLMKISRTDILLMDLHMPIMDGFETMKRIRKLKVKPLVIAISGNILQRNKSRCFEHGMNAFIAKPINISELNTLLRMI